MLEQCKHGLCKSDPDICEDNTNMINAWLWFQCPFFYAITWRSQEAHTCHAMDG